MQFETISTCIFSTNHAFVYMGKNLVEFSTYKQQAKVKVESQNLWLKLYNFQFSVKTAFYEDLILNIFQTTLSI